MPARGVSLGPGSRRREGMLEYPEIVTIAAQAGEYLVGKTVASAEFLTPEKKFVFCANSPSEFSDRLGGVAIDSVESCGNHLFLVSESGVSLNVGDTGGKFLYHSDEATIPKKRDLQLRFDDGTWLTHSVVMWGFFAAQTSEEMAKTQKKIRDEAREPVRAEVDVDHFVAFVRNWEEAEKINAKKLIVSRKYFTGLGNGYAQDILWRARIHPRRKMNTLSDGELRKLFDGFLDVVEEAVAGGGRTTERDLLDEPGRYEPSMYRGTLGKPCPECGAEIEKFSFEGGACYVCPGCQKL
jgi:formamidopyrimidine-DNA glycosylase